MTCFTAIPWYFQYGRNLACFRGGWMSQSHGKSIFHHAIHSFANSTCHNCHPSAKRTQLLWITHTHTHPNQPITHTHKHTKTREELWQHSGHIIKRLQGQPILKSWNIVGESCKSNNTWALSPDNLSDLKFLYSRSFSCWTNWKLFKDPQTLKVYVYNM